MCVMFTINVFIWCFVRFLSFCFACVYVCVFAVVFTIIAMPICFGYRLFHGGEARQVRRVTGLFGFAGGV